MPARRDPYGAFRFRIEVDGITVGGFNEVSGLTIETEVETIKEGGLNDFEHKLPKGVKHSNLTLKRGITDSTELWQWYDDVSRGIVKRKHGSIHLQNETAEDKITWHFFDAYPVKWEGSAFNSTGNSIATESVVLVHNGIKRLKA